MDDLLFFFGEASNTKQSYSLFLVWPITSVRTLTDPTVKQDSELPMCWGKCIFSTLTGQKSCSEGYRSAVSKNT